MRILFIGDIVGAAGRRIVLNELPRLLDEERIDFTIANGENVTNGNGINRQSFDELVACGVDCFTMGNHIWDNKDIYRFIDHEPRLVRPANFHPSRPGSGWQKFQVGEEQLIVTNLVGRVYMPPVDCPFAAMDRLLEEWRQEQAIIFLDFHAEATSEKMAMGWHLDGRISAMVGTHTHIQTNDARVLPRGCGYLTDAGMTGPRDSVLGVEKEIILERFRTGYSPRFQTASGDLQFNAAIYEIGKDRRCTQVQTLNFWQPSL